MKKYLLIILVFLVTSIFSLDFKDFSAFQSHLKKESKRVIDQQVHQQIRNSRTERNYQVGDTENFWRWDLSIMPPAWEQSQATCRAVGEFCYIFVADEDWETNMNQTDVDSVMVFLEETTMAGDDFGAIEMDINLFGDLPNELDNDEKVIVYYSALGSFAGSTFDGYFSSYNQVTETEAQQMNPPGHSNECEMIYMTCSPLNPLDPVRISVLSHELQHMIHWGYDINEDTWVDEGMAELAMVYFGMPDPITAFYSDANVSLNDWDQEWRDYIKVLLFFTYLDEQYNSGELISNIVAAEENGIDGILSQLEAPGDENLFEDIFTDWAIANFLDEPAIYDGKYNYERLDLPTFNHHHLINEFTEISGTVNPWATKYIRIFDIEDFEMTLDFELSHPQKIGIIKRGEDVASEVDTLTLATEEIIYPDTLSYPFTNRVIVLPNTTNSTLEYTISIQPVANEENEISVPKINLQNYPNPFNPTTTISYNNQLAGNVKLSIYNLKGQLVSQLCDEFQEKGNQTFVWDGTDSKGKIVSSGIYYYQIQNETKTVNRKMILLK